MKILVIWSGAVVPNYQGFFYHLAQYCQVKVLAPKKWKHGSVTFSGNTNPEKISAKNQNLNCEIILTDYLFANSAHYLVPGLFMHLWKYKPDLLYIMDEMDRISFFIHCGLTKLFFPKIKIVAYSLQNISHPSYYRFYHLLALKLNSLLVTGVITATKEAEKVLRERGFEQKTSTIPLWASETLFFPNQDSIGNVLRAELKIEPTEIVIVFSGSMVPEKGIELLQEAIKKTPNIRIISAGNGPSALRAMTAEKASQWIHLGPITGKKLLEFYQAGNYVILPSLTKKYWKEQVGRSLIEGILCGCVALGSDSGSIPDLTLFPEVNFKQGEVHSLIELLQNLPLQNHQQIYSAQLKNICANYTEASVAANTYQFFETLK